MILIKVNIKLTVERLEAVTTALRIYLMSQNHIYANGKAANDPDETLRFQLALRLAEKLGKKLMEKRLNPPAKKEFSIKLRYEYIYILHKALSQTSTRDDRMDVYLRDIIYQTDRLL